MEKTFSAHSFHIPVMGTGFTADTPLKVARFGISSAVSLVDDNLLEKLRAYHSRLNGIAYVPIEPREDDSRARRVQAYLDLLQTLVTAQFEALRLGSFDAADGPSVYFEMMEDGAPLKRDYHLMRAEKDPVRRAGMEAALKSRMRPGSIDVNIMTKLERQTPNVSERPEDGHYTDAMSALKGFAMSRAEGAVVFSAGVNPRLYSYLGQFPVFRPDGVHTARKRVILKVSDFRSAFIQAKMIAKKGVWVSEFRIESGLNCGGHAFATAGLVLGRVLAEFRERWSGMIAELAAVQSAALRSAGLAPPAEPPSARLTVQGGIGTAQEDRFLRRHYGVDGTGWGTPFLLVPEVTSVDERVLCLLSVAKEDDIYLSDSSPMGVPFYTLKNSPSEMIKRHRILKGTPGSPCLNGFVAFNTEFPGPPLCVASARYQRLKLKQLKSQDLPSEEFKRQSDRVTEKACICRDLGDGILTKYEIEDERPMLSPAVCPGPNLAYFDRVASLKEMVDHIYGRGDLLDPGRPRPHFLIKELSLYLDYLRKRVGEAGQGFCGDREKGFLRDFSANFAAGLRSYRRLACQLKEETRERRVRFLQDLVEIREQFESLRLQNPALLA